MFDQDKADRAVKFIKNLRHTKGEWAGRPFNLLEWEEKIIRDLFGTVNEDGTRQYRKAYISVGRKNGKTEICSALALYSFFADGESGAEIYSAAADRDQASLVFNASKNMVENAPALYKASKIINSTKRIVYHKRNSFYRAISSEAYTKHGYNPSLVIADELHVWPNRELWDVLETGMGARRQPMMIAITTAGWDRNSLCYELYDYAKKVSSGTIDDPTFYSAIYEVPEADDWKDEANWYKANPGLGIYRSLDEMRQMFKRACEVPAFENTFRRLYLNQWTSQETRWMRIEDWDACDAPVDMDSLVGRRAFGGIDLSSTTDITCCSLLFEPLPGTDVYDLLLWFWVPGENIIEKSRRDRTPYDLWQKQGLIEPTEGNVVDYAYIRQKINELGRKYWICEIGFDPWNATQLAVELQGDGFKMIPVRQGYASLSAPTKELLKLVLQRRIRHGRNPVLRHMVESMMVTQDSAGNLKPAKDKSTSRIDGVVATIIALDRASRNALGSIYQERGILTLDPEIPDIIAPKPEETPKNIQIMNAPKCLRCGSAIQSVNDFCSNCGAKILL